MSSNKAVIERVEARLARHIIDNRVCLEGCKCHVCFDKYLSSVLKASDALTPMVNEEMVEYVG